MLLLQFYGISLSLSPEKRENTKCCFNFYWETKNQPPDFVKSPFKLTLKLCNDFPELPNVDFLCFSAIVSDQSNETPIRISHHLNRSILFQ